MTMEAIQPLVMLALQEPGMEEKQGQHVTDLHQFLSLMSACCFHKQPPCFTLRSGELGAMRSLIMGEAEVAEGRCHRAKGQGRGEWEGSGGSKSQKSSLIL